MRQGEFVSRFRAAVFGRLEAKFAFSRIFPGENAVPQGPYLSHIASSGECRLRVEDLIVRFEELSDDMMM